MGRQYETYYAVYRACEGIDGSYTQKRISAHFNNEDAQRAAKLALKGGLYAHVTMDGLDLVKRAKATPLEALKIEIFPVYEDDADPACFKIYAKDLEGNVERVSIGTYRRAKEDMPTPTSPILRVTSPAGSFVPLHMDIYDTGSDNDSDIEFYETADEGEDEENGSALLIKTSATSPTSLPRSTSSYSIGGEEASSSSSTGSSGTSTPQLSTPPSSADTSLCSSPVGTKIRNLPFALPTDSEPAPLAIPLIRALEEASSQQQQDVQIQEGHLVESQEEARFAHENEDIMVPPEVAFELLARALFGKL